MEYIPTFFLIMFFALLGLIIGSFLDVVTTRFNTGASLNGRSRCLSCGHTLSWYELIPLLSYLLLLGRCTLCGSHIPLRLLLTELLTAALFLWSFSVFGLSLQLALVLLLVSVLIVIVLYDYDHMIIPHFFVYLLLILGASHVGLAYTHVSEPKMLLFQMLTALGTASFFGALWLVSKGRWIGLGDAKLAFALGLFLNPLSAFSMVVFSFWIGALVSVLLLLVQSLVKGGKKPLPFSSLQLTIKSEVPFAPFLVAAFILVFVGQWNIMHLLEYFYGFLL